MLLVGAGHAHLHLLVHVQALADAGYAVTLLAPATFRYSGVASASATGNMPTQVGLIDVARLVQGSPITHHVGVLGDLDLVAHRAYTGEGTWIDFDVVSFNIGSVAATSGIDLAREEDLLQIKPLEMLAHLRGRVDTVLANQDRARVTIVGAGPSGLELAGNLGVQAAVEVTLIEAGPTIHSGLPPRARERLTRLLHRRGVHLLTGVGVMRIEADQVRLSNGSTPGHDLIVLATGLVSSPLTEELGLADPGQSHLGIPVRSTLQHRDHDDVYAVGDCAHFVPAPLARIGVHGVRQGPVLLRALIARAAGDRPPEFEPQNLALQVLDLGGGQGLAVRGSRWWLGRSALWLKRWIDARWLRQYQKA